MAPARHQRTIRTPLRVSGFGYYRGQDVTVEFRPAPPNAGIVFVRTDLATRVPLRLSVANRVPMPRRTTLGQGQAQVEMVEHAAAALAGLGIDNCEVAVSAPEMPGLDGSALAFVEALDRAGIVEQAVPRRELVIRQPVRLGDETAWIEAQPSAGGGLTVEYRLDYGPGSAIGRQTFKLHVTPASFRQEIASARTFLLKQEADWLRSQGLGTRVTPRDLLIFDGAKVLDNQLRFADECVRHKLLDVVGDLALAGRPVVGQITAYRSGHQLNAELVEALLKLASAETSLRRTA